LFRRQPCCAVPCSDSVGAAPNIVAVLLLGYLHFDRHRSRTRFHFRNAFRECSQQQQHGSASTIKPVWPTQRALDIPPRRAICALRQLNCAQHQRHIQEPPSAAESLHRRVVMNTSRNSGALVNDTVDGGCPLSCQWRSCQWRNE